MRKRLVFSALAGILAIAGLIPAQLAHAKDDPGIESYTVNYEYIQVTVSGKCSGDSAVLWHTVDGPNDYHHYGRHPLPESSQSTFSIQIPIAYYGSHQVSIGCSTYDDYTDDWVLDKPIMVLPQILRSQSLLSAGESVELSGFGFAANAPVLLSLVGPNGMTSWSMNTTADASGRASFLSTLPSKDMPEGRYYLVMSAGAGESILASYTLYSNKFDFNGVEKESSKTKIAISNPNFAAGDEVTLYSSGFAPGETVAAFRVASDGSVTSFTDAAGQGVTVTADAVGYTKLNLRLPDDFKKGTEVIRIVGTVFGHTAEGSVFEKYIPGMSFENTPSKKLPRTGV